MSRLASGLLVNALVRRVNDAGGSAMVLARGDPDSGAILIVATDRGANPICYERGWNEQARPALVTTGPEDEMDRESAVAAYWRRRRERDSDLWVVELDSAEAKRFAAETIVHD